MGFQVPLYRPVRTVVIGMSAWVRDDFARHRNQQGLRHGTSQQMLGPQDVSEWRSFGSWPGRSGENNPWSCPGGPPRPRLTTYRNTDSERSSSGGPPAPWAWWRDAPRGRWGWPGHWFEAGDLHAPHRSATTTDPSHDGFGSYVTRAGRPPLSDSIPTRRRPFHGNVHR